MADTVLFDFCNPFESFDVHIVQTMTGTQTELEIKGLIHGPCNAVELFQDLGRRLCLGIMASVYLHHIGPDSVSDFDLLRIRIEKEAHINPLILELPDDFPVMLGFGFNVQPAFGRQLLPSFRNEGDEVRFCGFRNANHFRDCRHFQVEPCFHGLPKQAKVPVMNMAPVFPKMADDPLRSGQFRDSCSKHRVRFANASCLPKSRHMINVHSKARHSVSTSYSEIRARSLFSSFAMRRASFRDFS